MQMCIGFHEKIIYTHVVNNNKRINDEMVRKRRSLLFTSVVIFLGYQAICCWLKGECVTLCTYVQSNIGGVVVGALHKYLIFHTFTHHICLMCIFSVQLSFNSGGHGL